MLPDFPKMQVMSQMEDFTCLDVVKCIFNLNDTDMDVLKVLSDDDTMTPTQVGKAIRKDRSHAYRSLEKLLTIGLCFKERKSGRTRGYSNHYKRLPEKDIYKKAEESIDTCYTKIKQVLKSPGKHL